MNALSIISTVAVAVVTDGRTFEVLLSNMAMVQKGLENLAKRATRKGLSPVAFTFGKAYSRREHVAERSNTFGCAGPGCTKCRMVSRIPLTLQGDSPQFAGWTFVAALQHLGGDNIVRPIPGEAVPTMYRTRGPHCDHCKMVRRRNDTFVLRHTDGSTKQVGSTCIRDFLGNDDADMLASRASYLAEVRGLVEGGESLEGFGSASGGDLMLSSYLPVVAWCVEAEGWTSRTTAREDGGTATADRAWTYRTRIEDARRAGVEVTDTHTALAMSAEFWAENLTDAEVDASTGDYLHNLRAVARTGLVSFRSCGIAASMITAYQNAVGRQRMAAERAARPASEYIGTVGKRETFEARLDFVTGYDTDYGYTTVLKFVTEAGNVLCWKASNTDIKRDDVGKVYTVTGTVKVHESYKGTKQTGLTRCKVVVKP